jgi:hypothetical protein
LPFFKDLAGKIQYFLRLFFCIFASSIHTLCIKKLSVESIQLTQKNDMEKEDYLERQINQIGRILGKIISGLLGRKSQGQVNTGIEIVNQMLKSELDFDTQDLMAIQTDLFVNTLISEKKFNSDNLEKLAEILLLIADDEKKSENKILYEKCLVIFDYLEKTGNVYSFDRTWKMEQIKEKLL